jgi:hypothetical protein
MKKVQRNDVNTLNGETGREIIKDDTMQNNVHFYPVRCPLTVSDKTYLDNHQHPNLISH